MQRQNNPKYGNLSRNFHIFLTASGEGRGGPTQAVSLTAFSQVFFDDFPVRSCEESQITFSVVGRGLKLSNMSQFHKGGPCREQQGGKMTKGRLHKTKSGKSVVFCQTPLGPPPWFGIFSEQKIYPNFFLKIAYIMAKTNFMLGPT